MVWSSIFILATHNVSFKNSRSQTHFTFKQPRGEWHLMISQLKPVFLGKYTEIVQGYRHIDWCQYEKSIMFPYSGDWNSLVIMNCRPHSFRRCAVSCHVVTSNTIIAWPILASEILCYNTQIKSAKWRTPEQEL